MPGEEPGQKPPSTPKVFDIPEPEVRAREATPDEVPPRSGARQMLKLALGCGWDAHMTFARGAYINADGSFNRIVDSLALWARRDGGLWAKAWWVFNPNARNAKGDIVGAYELEAASHRGSHGLVKSDVLKKFIRTAD